MIVRPNVQGRQTIVSCATMRTKLKMASTFTENINKTSDTISLSPFEVQLFSNTTNSNNYLISKNNNKSLLEKDFNNKEIELSTNSLNNKSYISSNLSSPEIYNPTTYYNKFLYYYRLQSLPSPQTISSFLQYILEYILCFTQTNKLKFLLNHIFNL